MPPSRPVFLCVCCAVGTIMTPGHACFFELFFFRAKSLSLPRGTICYLAPEVLKTVRPVAYRTMAAVYAFNAQTDVFAFG